MNKKLGIIKRLAIVIAVAVIPWFIGAVATKDDTTAENLGLLGLTMINWIIGVIILVPILVVVYLVVVLVVWIISGD